MQTLFVPVTLTSTDVRQSTCFRGEKSQLGSKMLYGASYVQLQYFLYATLLQCGLSTSLEKHLKLLWCRNGLAPLDE